MATKWVKWHANRRTGILYPVPDWGSKIDSLETSHPDRGRIKRELDPEHVARSRRLPLDPIDLTFEEINHGLSRWDWETVLENLAAIEGEGRLIQFQTVIYLCQYIRYEDALDISKSKPSLLLPPLQLRSHLVPYVFHFSKGRGWASIREGN